MASFKSKKGIRQFPMSMRLSDHSLLFFSAIFERLELVMMDYMFYFRDFNQKTKVIQKGAEQRKPVTKAATSSYWG